MELFLAIDEQHSMINDLYLAPNPATSFTRVNFNLENSMAVAYEIRDMQGRLVTFANKGIYNAGSQNFEINVNEIAAGNYMLNVVLDGRSMVSTPLVIVK